MPPNSLNPLNPLWSRLVASSIIAIAIPPIILAFSSRSLAQVPAPPAPEVMVPNPSITIDGAPATSGVPSLQPRAIAPPVGDISVGTIDPSATNINLGTTQVIPRLVLREAPVREVLSLLARAAGLNLAYDDSAAPSATPTDSTTATEPTISLDIENEPVQNVFNYVLQLSGLQANRRGTTIFVSRQLPNAARNLTIRSLRLNQVTVGVALNFLVGMGAESAVSRERLVTSVNAIAVELPDDVATRPSVTQTQTTTEDRIETQRVEYEDSTPILRGLLVLGDERTNTISLIGDPRQVEIASAQLTQLDVRRRQVAVNVRIVDVDLSALNEFSSSFSFGINDSFFQWDTDGLGVDFSPRTNSGNAFRASLEAQITEGNAKILTDPTLIVQEGQRATVALTEEVPTTTGETTFDENGNLVTFEQDDPRAAGLTLAIEVTRIDDNGFVSLSVAPTVTAPAGEQENPDGSNTTLLSARSLESGQIRLRDGQTLILSGIIQDSDRTTVAKVPILGDIPILGALFRSTERTNERREVIVMLTPQILDDSDNATFGYQYLSPTLQP
ncbi:MAG TPA: secretin and TonB N-terminal domain-containing protein [Chroococcidiopsis sp.]